MQTDRPTAFRPSILTSVRRHLVVVTAFLLVGLGTAWLLVAAMPATYTSTAQVLLNPTVGNPFAPVPTAVRQDEVTSLETEAQVVRSAEVLSEVAAGFEGLTRTDIEDGLEVTLPPNTQILEVSYSAENSAVAREVTSAVARGYLANRERRASEVNEERVARVEAQTTTVVEELRAATVAAQQGTSAQRLFQSELAAARRNELVSLRAQRSYLESSEAPAGSVISPASVATTTNQLTAPSILAGGALAGLLLGCLVAVARERSGGQVRSAAEVEAIGLPVLAGVADTGWRARASRTASAAGFDATIRRLRAEILERQDPTEVIAVAPVGPRRTGVAVSEALAESFARAGHRVVLVGTDEPATPSGLEATGPGLGEALAHERLNVLDMLQPSVEPLLCLLPWGSPSQSRELLAVDRLRTVLAPLLKDGHLVVLQSPAIDTVEGEAVAGAADLGVVVVTASATRARDVERVAARAARMERPALAAVVVDARSSNQRGRHATSGVHIEHTPATSVEHEARTRTHR